MLYVFFIAKFREKIIVYTLYANSLIISKAIVYVCHLRVCVAKLGTQNVSTFALETLTPVLVLTIVYQELSLILKTLLIFQVKSISALDTFFFFNFGAIFIHSYAHVEGGNTQVNFAEIFYDVL